MVIKTKLVDEAPDQAPDEIRIKTDTYTLSVMCDDIDMIKFLLHTKDFITPTLFFKFILRKAYYNHFISINIVKK